MKQLNDILEKIASPLKTYSNYLLRIGLGISFFLHGYGKIPIQESFINWLSSKGIPFAETTAHLIAWGEMISGIGILLGGLIGTKASVTGNLITRLSGGAVTLIGVSFLVKEDLFCSPVSNCSCYWWVLISRLKEMIDN